MKAFKNIKIGYLCIIVLMLTLMSAFTSCDGHKSRIVGKLTLEIDQSTENDNKQTNNSYRNENSGHGQPNSNNRIREYAVDGFCLTNGRFRHLMDKKYAKVVISNDHGYFEYFSKKTPINKNYDSVIYVAPQLKDVPMDGSPTPENIMLDVSIYDFKSIDGNTTYYFNLLN